MTLGQRLLTLRKLRNLNQEDLQKEFTLSSGCYSLYENDKRKPGYETLIKFANFYNVSLDYLLGRTEEPVTPSNMNVTFPKEEIELIIKYRALDEHGKNLVNTVLDCEYGRTKEKLDKSSKKTSA